MNLSSMELRYLLKLVHADLQRMDILADHAIAHGAEIVLPDHVIAGDITNLVIHALITNAG